MKETNLNSNCIEECQISNKLLANSGSCYNLRREILKPIQPFWIELWHQRDADCSKRCMDYSFLRKPKHKCGQVSVKVEFDHLKKEKWLQHLAFLEGTFLFFVFVSMTITCNNNIPIYALLLHIVLYESVFMEYTQLTIETMFPSANVVG